MRSNIQTKTHGRTTKQLFSNTVTTLVVVTLIAIVNLSLQNLDMETIVVTDFLSPQSVSPHDTANAYLHRMNYYKERYRYQPPLSYTNYTERDLLCGAAPQYYKFFNLTKNQGRSANDEDLAIYNLFFRDQRQQQLSVVEMGAFTGLSESNSRFFELCLGWNTLLVEGMPATFDKLVQNRPHVSICIAVENSMSWFESILSHLSLLFPFVTFNALYYFYLLYSILYYTIGLSF